jgi:hypothetical protein
MINCRFIEDRRRTTHKIGAFTHRIPTIRVNRKDIICQIISFNSILIITRAGENINSFLATVSTAHESGDTYRREYFSSARSSAIREAQNNITKIPLNIHLYFVLMIKWLIFIDIRSEKC